MKLRKLFSILLLVFIIGCPSGDNDVTPSPVVGPPTISPSYSETESLRRRIARQQALVTYYTTRCNKYGLDCDKVVESRMKLEQLLNSR